MFSRDIYVVDTLLARVGHLPTILTCLLTAVPGHSKLGQDGRYDGIYSFGHWPQFPSVPHRRPAPVVVLLSSHCVSPLVRLAPI